MKWLVFIVISAALMVYGQAAEPHSNSDKGRSTTKNADASDPAGQTVTVVNQQTPQRQENNHPGKPPSYLHELLVPANLPNLLLVGVGIAGIITALHTLKVLARQTAAIERQASAQMEALRARITIEFADNVFHSILHDGRVNVVARFINTGGTPAYRVVPETWIEFVSRFGDEVRDLPANAVHHVSNPVAVYPTTPTLFDIPLGRRASYDEIAGLRQATTTLAVRIRLTYESLGQPYFVDRQFTALPDGMRFDPRHNEAD